MEKVMNEKIIMNYEVVELLHKSSSWGNIVFKVKPQNKEKLYVLKCFPKIENGLQKLIFKREIEALRTLNVCEGIVKLRDSSTELYPFKENECYGGILMDYVPGETLDHINWNKYTQLKKYEICLQILKAVNNAHSNNVIHRDLKPSNIIYDKYADKVTLIDFGTSKIKTVMDSETTMPLDRYLKTKTGVRQSTKQGYVTVQRLLAKETFGKKTIRSVKTSDAKLFLIKLQQEDGKSYSSIHTIRGVLRPAFQMAVDDDILVKNPFGFQLAGVLVNDAVTREVIYKDQMRKFLKFVHDDVAYCKYYEVVYILFHTGMRISEFCGLTLKDIDLEKMTVNIDHQLQRTSDMRYIIETTKTDAGTRVLPITEDVAEMFQAIIEDRNASKVEKDIDGYSGFLFYDDNGMPLVAMHWQHRFNHMVGRYNDIYRVQMPNITLHVCRHTYCSNMAKPGMNPKTLQYLMGHSDISVTMNVYTHIGFDDAEEELKRIEEFRKARAEVEQKKEKPMSQKMFKVI